MRAILILIAAVMFGLAGGYAWSAMLASPAHGRVPKPHRTAMIDPPEIAADKEWAARGEDQGRPAVEQTGPDPAENPKDVEQSVYYASCADARARATRTSTPASPATALPSTPTATASPASPTAAGNRHSS
jgi:hypothetical protein